jgi:DNA-binding XRE family transcriptional regulator
MKKWTSEDIINLRMKYDITQAKLADLIGVATNYVYMMEKGVRNPSKPLQLLLSRIEEDFKKEGR